MTHVDLEQGTHYAYRSRAQELAVFSESAAYFAAVSDAITRAQRRILIVGWSLDDRIRLLRDDPAGTGSASRAADSVQGRSLGELLVDRAREHPDLRIQLRIWQAPAVFAADQYITEWFQDQARALDNLDFLRVPAASAFAARHEKYVIVDDTLAFVGGIDLSHNRWDTVDHRGENSARTNPDGEHYVPYHDTQLLFSGPAVRDLFAVAVQDRLIKDDWAPPGDEWSRKLWLEYVPVDLRDQDLLLSFTRVYPERDDEDLHQIFHLYRDLLYAAEERIYIENQYFSSDEITAALISQLEDPNGPEVIIIMSWELPDALGRMTMGVNSAMQLSQLIEHDSHHRLGIFHPFSTDEHQVPLKVHSKTMIIDGTLITLGSANISRRSFSLDSEINATICGDTPGHVPRDEPAGAASTTDADPASTKDADPAATKDADPAATKDAHPSSSAPPTTGIAAIEDRLLAQHTGLSVEDWRRAVERHDGSYLAALRERITTWIGLTDGRDHVVAEVPSRMPKEIIERFDMEEPPPQETVLQRIARFNPWDIITRTRRAWIISLVAIAAIGALFYAARSDLDIRVVLQRIEEINRERPLVGALLTIGAFWVTMTFFVTIVVPIVFFSALHGPLLGILYSTLGIFSGAAIFYGIGLALHTSPWPDRYRAVRRVKAQLERIKPYGLWAVAISRMVPSGPFMVVNLVTGLLGFSPAQFLAGSAVGLLPGIVAFSIFGEVIRNVFTDPGLMSTIWFVVFVVVYFASVRGLLVVVKRTANWVTGDSRR